MTHTVPAARMACAEVHLLEGMVGLLLVKGGPCLRTRLVEIESLPQIFP